MLTDLANLDNLHDAWHAVRRKHSAPGVDGVTVEEFGTNASERLRRLRRDLLKGSYRPLPLRGGFIPKATTGWRAIGIPAVRDRVAQRACLNVLTPVLEPEFEACSYAYREGRSIYQAIAQVEDWRDRGNRVLLDGDIEDCFDSIDRDLLLDLLRQYVREEAILALVRLWLEAGVAWRSARMGVGGFHGVGEKASSRLQCYCGDRDASRGHSRTPILPHPHTLVVPPVGIPQGDIISPVLCNVFLDEFDEALLHRRFKLVRYADDFLVLTASRARAEEALEAAQQALSELGLRLNREKTGITTFDQGFKYLGAIFVRDMMLPTIRQERRTPSGEEEILFVPGYPSAPRRSQSRHTKATTGEEQRPAPPEARGLVAVSTTLAEVRSPRQLGNPFTQALQQALKEKRRTDRKRLQKEAEKPWETTFLL